MLVGDVGDGNGIKKNVVFFGLSLGVSRSDKSWVSVKSTNSHERKRKQKKKRLEENSWSDWKWRDITD